MFPRAIAVLVLSLAATLSLSTTATAAPYPPGDQAGVASSACMGQFVAEAGYFDPGETVTITLEGSDAQGVTLAVGAREAQAPATFTAADDGGLVVDIRNRATTDGDFELTTTGTQSPVRGPILFSLTASCTPAADEERPVGTALPSTGADLSGIGIVGGMLALGALALGGTIVVRHRRS